MSRYSTYDDFIDEVSAEAGETEGAYDTILLNLCKAVVDQLNLRRSRFRQKKWSLTIAAGEADYDLSSVASDFVEPVDYRTALQMADGTFIELDPVGNRFREGWSTTPTGSPYLAWIFGDVLYLRPTPSTSGTYSLYGYKRLATPTSAGTVTIPDEYLSLVRARLLKRFATYDQNDTLAAAYSEVEADVLRALNRDDAVHLLPGAVEVTQDW